ncbi:MAG: CdaR family protein [Pyrinomonadaceae bacterium]|nr:CdaR family protein [Pyrinomonadaceae bacterium]
MFSFPTEKFLESEQRRQFFINLLERIFLRDWGTKLIALAITLAIWFGITGQTTTRRIQTIHLNFISPNTMQISNEPIHEIEITVSGDKNKIDRLKSEDLIASVDLSSVNSGEKVLELKPENVNLDLPSGVKLVEIQPNKILVKLEKTVEREIKVSAETEGNLANGFEIYDKIFSPAFVRVRGPESIIKSLENILT